MKWIYLWLNFPSFLCVEAFVFFKILLYFFFIWFPWNLQFWVLFSLNENFISFLLQLSHFWNQWFFPLFFIDHWFIYFLLRLLLWMHLWLLFRCISTPAKLFAHHATFCVVGWWFFFSSSAAAYYNLLFSELCQLICIINFFTQWIPAFRVLDLVVTLRLLKFQTDTIQGRILWRFFKFLLFFIGWIHNIALD